jgi:DNA-binding CsgD family transcriptional regulator
MNPALTPRERELLQLIWSKGVTNRQAAKLLKINSRTVESHTNSMHKKTGTRNIAELLRWGVAHGEISINCARRKVK